MRRDAASNGATRHPPYCVCGVHWHAGRVSEGFHIKELWRVTNAELYSRTHAKEEAEKAEASASWGTGLLAGLGIGLLSGLATGFGLHFLKRFANRQVPAAVGAAVGLTAAIVSGYFIGRNSGERAYEETYEKTYAEKLSQAQAHPEWIKEYDTEPKTVETFDEKPGLESPCHWGYRRQSREMSQFQGQCRPSLTMRLGDDPLLSAVNAEISFEEKQWAAMQRMGAYGELSVSLDPIGETQTGLPNFMQRMANEQSLVLQLPKSLVCPANNATASWRTVRVSARAKDRFSGKDMPGFEPFETSAAYQCPATEQPKQGWMGVAYSFSVDDDRHVRVGIGIQNKSEFHQIYADNGYIEVNLYAGDSQGNERKISSYRMQAAQANYTFPEQQVCNRSAYNSYHRYLKAKVVPRSGDGRRLSQYGKFQGARYRVTCAGSAWNNYEYLEDTEDDIFD